MKGPAAIVLIVGVLALGAYLVINATSQSSSSCTGGLSDYFNPSCWFSSVVDTATNEVNTVLIIVALVVVVVVGLLAFGPSTGHIAKGVAAFL